MSQPKASSKPPSLGVLAHRARQVAADNARLLKVFGTTDPLAGYDAMFRQGRTPSRDLDELLGHLPEQQIERQAIAIERALRSVGIGAAPTASEGVVKGEVGAPVSPPLPPKGWCGPGVEMKVAARRLGFKSKRSLMSRLSYIVKKNMTEDDLWDLRPGGLGRKSDGKFREDYVAAYEAARMRVPEAARAAAEGAFERATEVGRKAARQLPLAAMKRAFGRLAGK